MLTLMVRFIAEEILPWIYPTFFKSNEANRT